GPITIDTSRPLPVAWSGAEGTALDISLACADIHDDPGHSSVVRCTVPGESETLTVPKELLHYLPTCSAGEVLITSQSEEELDLDWPYVLRVERYAQTADGIETSASMVVE